MTNKLEEFPDSDAWAASIADDFKASSMRQPELKLAPQPMKRAVGFETFAAVDLTNLGR
ncbi:MAG TPA: hypothetical protein VEF76_14035 [Patescibacteria group bacterium]|nr:hypothetical protein [Patescibacteria group bacterium]